MVYYEEYFRVGFTDAEGGLVRCNGVQQPTARNLIYNNS